MDCHARHENDSKRNSKYRAIDEAAQQGRFRKGVAQPVYQGGATEPKSWSSGEFPRRRGSRAGAQTISIVEEDPLVGDGAFPVEEAGEPDDELIAALSSARERGHRRVAEILSEDDMLSADAFSDLLGVSRVTVNTKRENGQVLGLDGAKRGFRFPAWQLDRDGRPYAALPKLQEILTGAWSVYRFLVSPHGALDGRTGLDGLKRGQDSDVIAAAEGVARGDFR